MVSPGFCGECTFISVLSHTGMVARKMKIPLVDASDVLPSWDMPKLDKGERKRLLSIIGSHRFGNLTEVEMIHKIIHENPV